MAEKRVKRRLTAILAADVVGYSRLMGEDEAGTLAALKERYSQIIGPRIAAYGGRVVKLMGDGTLAEFGSVVDAVQSAIDIQQDLADRNAEVTQDRRIELRIGINLGDVILDGDDIYGDGVNVAARLEALAEPGGVCISGTVYDAVGNKLPTHFEYIGEQHLKNIERPVRAYQMAGGHASPGIRPAKPGTHEQTASKVRSKPSLAIKPFENLGSDPEQDQVADAISNGIIAALTRMPQLTLIGDESPSLHRSKQMTVQEFGQAFDVHYVLKGSLRKLGNRIRVYAELMEVQTGRLLWAEDFDRNLGDVAALFDIQDEITEEIVTALDVKLFGGEAVRLVRRTFRDPMALQSYYNGEMLLWDSKSRLELREAQRLLEESIRLEPTSSVGYATAALAYWVEALSGQSDTPEKTLELAVERAQEAIRLGDVTGYPHLVLAQVHLSKHEFDEASAEADLAVSARPSCPAAYSLKASVLNYLGRPSEAIEYAQYALRLTPVHPPIYPAILASAFYGSERYEEAVAAAKTAIELDESHIDPYLVLIAASIALEHSEDARWAADKVRRLKPTFNLTEFAIAQPYRDQTHLDRLMDHLRTAGFK
ncbi:MAG TPA: adenylate/guanylate cyclase domain-containing protein [Nitrospiraceae bacterium]